MSYIDREDRANFYFNCCLETDEAKNNDTYRTILQFLAWSITDDLTTLSASEIMSTSGALQFLYLEKYLNGEHDLHKAEAILQQLLDLAKKNGDEMFESIFHLHYSNLFYIKKEYALAVDSAETALRFLERSNDPDALEFQCFAYSYLCLAHNCLGHPNQKQKYLDLGIKLAKNLGLENYIASLYFSLARTVNLQENNRKNQRTFIDYCIMGYAFCSHKVDPLISFLLGVEIIALWNQDRNGDKNLVTKDELKLMCQIFLDDFNPNYSNDFDKIGIDSTVASQFIQLAAMVQKQLDEGDDSG